MMEFKIYGKAIEKESKKGISNLIVEALDKDLCFDDRLGSVITDKDGNFEIKYDKEDFQELFFDKKPDIYLRIKSPDGKLICTTEDKVRYDVGKTKEFLIPIPVEKLLGYILPSFKTTILRPQDMLKLEFKFINLELQENNRDIVLVRAYPDNSSYIVVTFPPQNIAEEAFFESATDPDDPNDVVFPVETPPDKPPDPDKNTSDETPYYPVKSRISGPSHLVFKIPKDEDVEIRYTTEGLLEACSKYELSVAPTALPPSEDEFKKSTIDFFELAESVSVFKDINPNNYNLIFADTAEAKNTLANLSIEDKSKIEAARAWCAQSALAKRAVRASDNKIAAEIKGIYHGFVIVQPKLQKPSSTETSIEAPFRLIISPNRFAAWAHAINLVKSPISERIELWHTRHAVRKEGKIDEEDERLRRVRAIWTRDHGFNKDYYAKPSDHYDPVNLTYNNPFRMSLDAFDRNNIVHLSANYHITMKSGKKYWPRSIPVEQLMLTSLGAWMNVRGTWEPPTPLSIEEWRHRGTMGRDHYVRVVYKGYLFPFGHRASLVKITERKFHQEVTSILKKIAGLFYAKIDSHARTIEDNLHPEVASFKKSINDNFDKEVTSLVSAIDGKSPEEIASLVEDSKCRFHKKTASLTDKVEDKIREDIVLLAGTAKDEYRVSVDSIVGAIRKMVSVDVPGNIAYLRQRMYIVVREPERFYDKKTGVKNQNGHSYDLQMPFNSVRITTLVTPNLDDPDYSDIKDKKQSLFWPKVGNKDFQFHLIAEDLDGNQVEFTAPLVFVDQREAKENASMKDVQNDYKNGVEERRKRPIYGQSVAFANSKKQGDTTLETQYLTFGAEIPDDSDFNKLKNKLGKDIPQFYPKVKEAEVLIPSIKHLAGNNQIAKIGYYEEYLKDVKDGFTNNRGEVFAKLVDEIDLDFNSQGDRSGGLVKPNMQIKGISRLMGPVAGDLKKISVGTSDPTFDPEDFFGDLDAKIFGVIDLWDIIQAVGGDNFIKSLTDTDDPKAPKLITDTSTPGELKVIFKWNPEVKDWNNLFIASNESKDASLQIKAELCARSLGEPDIDINCTMQNFSIDLIGNIESFIIIRFDEIVFISKGGEKPDVNVKMGDIEFVGVLSFVETLKDLIPLDGFSDPPSIDVTEKGISAGFSIGLPSIAVGVLNIQNISLGASFTVPFINDPLSVRFNFCERQSPFTLTVWAFGGGGFFAITLDPGGVQLLEASFEFGASLSVDFGVASGGVHVMAGIYFKMEMTENKAELTGYFRMGGEVDVLGIISVSIELYLRLHYEFSSGKCVGKATLTIEVEVLFFSVSVEISCERKFAGSSGDPSFKELMEPYTDPITKQEVKPWEEYYRAFA